MVRTTGSADMQGLNHEKHEIHESLEARVLQEVAEIAEEGVGYPELLVVVNNP